MTEKEFFIYKYIHDGEVIYIGLSTNIVERIRQHKRCQGLDAKFSPFIDNCTVYIHRCSTEKEMIALESLLIELYKPILNKKNKTEIESTVLRDDFVEWVPYSEHDFTDRNINSQTRKKTSVKMSLQDTQQLQKKQIFAAEQELSDFKNAIQNILVSVDVKSEELKIPMSNMNKLSLLTSGVSFTINGYGFMSVNPPIQHRRIRATGQSFIWFKPTHLTSWMSDVLKQYEDKLCEIKKKCWQ